MTRKDFELIARVLYQERTVYGLDNRLTADALNEVADVFAQRFADALSDTNERFSRSRFLAACGVTR